MMIANGEMQVFLKSSILEGTSEHSVANSREDLVAVLGVDGAGRVRVQSRRAAILLLVLVLDVLHRRIEVLSFYKQMRILKEGKGDRRAKKERGRTVGGEVFEEHGDGAVQNLLLHQVRLVQEEDPSDILLSEEL